MKTRITLLALVVILVLPFARPAIGNESALRIDDNVLARQVHCQNRQDKREDCRDCYSERSDECQQQEVLEEFINQYEERLNERLN